jgi:hypothetical protein
MAYSGGGFCGLCLRNSLPNFSAYNSTPIFSFRLSFCVNLFVHVLFWTINARREGLCFDFKEVVLILFSQFN